MGRFRQTEFRVHQGQAGLIILTTVSRLMALFILTPGDAPGSLAAGDELLNLALFRIWVAIS